MHHKVSRNQRSLTSATSRPLVTIMMARKHKPDPSPRPSPTSSATPHMLSRKKTKSTRINTSEEVLSKLTLFTAPSCLHPSPMLSDDDTLGHTISNNSLSFPIKSPNEKLPTFKVPSCLLPPPCYPTTTLSALLSLTIHGQSPSNRRRSLVRVSHLPEKMTG